MIIFRSDSRLLASAVLTIAGRLVLGGMVGSQTMRAQQSPQVASIVSSNQFRCVQADGLAAQVIP